MCSIAPSGPTSGSRTLELRGAIHWGHATTANYEEPVSRSDDSLGVLVVAIGSSRPAANARTATVAPTLAAGTRRTGATTSFATVHEPGPHSLPAAADRLRRQGARTLAIAPWFLAPGMLVDQVSSSAQAAGIAMVSPLGAHTLVATTVLDRFGQAAAELVAT